MITSLLSISPAIRSPLLFTPCHGWGCYRRPHTAEDRSQSNSHGICGGQRGTGTGFCLSNTVFSRSCYIITHFAYNRRYTALATDKFTLRYAASCFQAYSASKFPSIVASTLPNIRSQHVSKHTQPLLFQTYVARTFPFIRNQYISQFIFMFDNYKTYYQIKL
jgi:hypothetical protein